MQYIVTKLSLFLKKLNFDAELEGCIIGVLTVITTLSIYIHFSVTPIHYTRPNLIHVTS